MYVLTRHLAKQYPLKDVAHSGRETNQHHLTEIAQAQLGWLAPHRAASLLRRLTHSPVVAPCGPLPSPLAGVFLALAMRAPPCCPPIRHSKGAQITWSALPETESELFAWARSSRSGGRRGRQALGSRHMQDPCPKSRAQGHLGQHPGQPNCFPSAGANNSTHKLLAL